VPPHRRGINPPRFSSARVEGHPYRHQPGHKWSLRHPGSVALPLSSAGVAWHAYAAGA
jgi:hypothetical protein